MTPGTSCLATIMLSLWDEDILRAEALIKSAVMRFRPNRVNPPRRPRQPTLPSKYSHRAAAEHGFRASTSAELTRAP